MALKFGTSGVRGLVTEMTDRECFQYAQAFVRYLKSRSPAVRVALAGDYRSSTPRIMYAVARAIREEGMQVDPCGAIPTPAVMNHGIRNNMASIMVTGSHIPDDRNGIKFNMPWGEALKEDEKEISARFADIGRAGEPRESLFAGDGSFIDGAAAVPEPVDEAARNAYIARYLDFFQPGCLEPLKIVCYQHSSVAREILPRLLTQLGAEVIPVGFSEAFIPLDTEAVQDPDRLAAWVEEHGADALVSADGDGDRPLVVDERGEIVRGDILGILVADFLRANSVSTPVSCNTALELCGRFESISRTRIGSPYVVSSMIEAFGCGHARIVGYEANGGFLTATPMTDSRTGAVLEALPTRDAALPIISILLSSLRKRKTLSGLVRELPPRFTWSGLLREFPNTVGLALVESLRGRGEAFANETFSSAFGPVASMDFTDGARMIFASGDIVHLRPSGNAPEFRCYTESASAEQAARNNETALGIVAGMKSAMNPGETP